MSIYSQIKEKFIMPGAYSDWGEYRKQLTRLLSKDITQEIVGYERVNEGYVGTRMKPVYKQGGLSIAIVGAGACNDIDLFELSGHFEHITLIDIDDEAMRNAVDWMPDMLKERVTVRQGSVTGITDADQEEFCNRMIYKINEQESYMKPEMYNMLLLGEVMRLGSKLYTGENSLAENGLLPVGGYDVVACIGVHSQLMSLLSYIINVITHNVSEQLFQGEMPDTKKATDYLKKMNEHIIPIINSAILKSSNERSVFGNEHNSKHPVEGAYQCIMDLRKRGLNISEQHLTWNFNPERNVEYDMLIQIV